MLFTGLELYFLYKYVTIKYIKRRRCRKMNGSEMIEELLVDDVVLEEDSCSSNVHSQTWHDSWRNSID